MNRYLTTMTSDGFISAFTEEEHRNGKTNLDDAGEWVWQFADTKEQAIAQHCEKHDEWYDSVNRGEEEKATY